MSLNNANPTLWSDTLLAQLRANLVFASCFNRQYEGTINRVGDTVKIISIGDVTISDYIKDTILAAPQTLTDAETMLTIERAKSFNFAIDDVDQAQNSAGGGLMREAMSWAAYKLAATIDTYAAAFYAQAAIAAPTYPLGTQAAPITPALPIYTLVGGGTVMYDYLVTVSQYMSDNLVPLNGRWIILPPWAGAQLSLDPRFTGYNSARAGDLIASGRLQQSASATSGGASGADVVSIGGVDSGAGGASVAYLGQVATLDVYQSPNSPLLSGTAGLQNCINVAFAGHPMGASLAVGLNKVELFRHPSYFSDNCKGLCLYGAKITRPSMLASFIIKHV